MFLKSLREQINLLKRQGDLRIINRPVDSYLEAAAIIRRSTETKAPVPLMTNIKGYPGCSIVGGSQHCHLILNIRSHEWRCHWGYQQQQVHSLLFNI